MKLIKSTEFMEKYRILERAIRDNYNVDFSAVQGGPVSYYEQQVAPFDELKGSKIRYLRIARNILVHNSGTEDFIVFTDTHAKFLDECIKDVCSINGVVKDQYTPLSKANVLSPTDTLQAACEMFVSKKTDVIYVVDVEKNTMHYLRYKDIIAAYAIGKTKAHKVGRLDGLKEFEQPLVNGIDINSPLSFVEKQKYGVPVINRGKIVGILP